MRPRDRAQQPDHLEQCRGRNVATKVDLRTCQLTSIWQASVDSHVIRGNVTISLARLLAVERVAMEDTGASSQMRADGVIVTRQ